MKLWDGEHSHAPFCSGLATSHQGRKNWSHFAHWDFTAVCLAGWHKYSREHCISLKYSILWASANGIGNIRFSPWWYVLWCSIKPSSHGGGDLLAEIGPIWSNKHPGAGEGSSKSFIKGADYRDVFCLPVLTAHMSLPNLSRQSFSESRQTLSQPLRSTALSGLSYACRKIHYLHFQTGFLDQFNGLWVKLTGQWKLWVKLTEFLSYPHP